MKINIKCPGDSEKFQISGRYKEKNRHRKSDVGFFIRLIGKRLKAVTARRPQSSTRRRPLRLQNSPQESFADGASLLEVRFLLNTIKNRHRKSDVGFFIRLIGIEPTTTRRRRPVLYPLSYRRRYCKRRFAVYNLFLKYSIVDLSPSSSITCGSQESFCLARVMSGLRLVGSSFGRGL